MRINEEDSLFRGLKTQFSVWGLEGPHVIFHHSAAHPPLSTHSLGKEMLHLLVRIWQIETNQTHAHTHLLPYTIVSRTSASSRLFFSFFKPNYTKLLVFCICLNVPFQSPLSWEVFFFLYYLNFLLNNFSFSFASLTEVEKSSRLSTEMQGRKVLWAWIKYFQSMKALLNTLDCHLTVLSFSQIRLYLMGLIKYNMELWLPRGKNHTCCGPKCQALTLSHLIWRCYNEC